MGFEGLAASETAQSRLNANAGWLKFLDGATGCYAMDVDITPSSSHTKVSRY